MHGSPPWDDVDTTAVGERILAAASELFYLHGITATGVELIAERAHTTKRTLYQRFGSKEGLVAAYLRRRAHLWQVELHEKLKDAASASASGRLDVVFSAAIDRAASATRGCAFVNAWAECGPADTESARLIVGEKRWMADLFTGIAGDAGKGRVIHMLYEGAQIRSTILGDDTALPQARDQAEVVLGRDDA
ncbi:TetR/AcrR family transcriptional regulator [Dietzia lutea]|uniref:HTH tetR-type domain-containing protein n=1 Tax=Dietzia lutea TaxID=546160 RepID=A0A2S1R9F0_9ACTN|nr:TetR/AcrR family transcriptional regulator [Dietzia lutea]AWH92882.1 hypothetical protein A6035_12700 [Dietzia lutea]